MKKQPVSELFEDIATELGVDPSFVEKDWFAVQVLTHIASLEIPQIIFTGGTSLSKAYGLIQRFSEDLDFRICSATTSFNRSQRKELREIVLNQLRQIEGISIIEESLQSHNESNFFSVDCSYPQTYQPTIALRPHLKLEFSFEQTLIQPEYRPIQSFVTQFTAEDQTDCSIVTISPIETAANKYSALLWRINVRDRNAPRTSIQNDPAMIRHLHDLASLEQLITSEPRFTKMVISSFEKDQGRGGSDSNKSLKDLTNEAIEKLQSDAMYKTEYIQFVNAMSYAPENELLSFDQAIVAFHRIATAFCGD